MLRSIYSYLIFACWVVWQWTLSPRQYLDTSSSTNPYPRRATTNPRIIIPQEGIQDMASMLKVTFTPIGLRATALIRDQVYIWNMTEETAGEAKRLMGICAADPETLLTWDDVADFSEAINHWLDRLAAKREQEIREQEQMEKATKAIEALSRLKSSGQE